MNNDEKKNFQAFIKDSFKDGLIRRELRLNACEVAWLEEMYSKVKISEMACNAVEDDKKWYVVGFRISP